MSIQVTSLDQLEVGTVLEQKFYDWGKSTHWVITDIKEPPYHWGNGNIAVYADRVRKSDHKVIVRGSNGLPTYSTVIAWFITGELKKEAFTLTVIESKQVVEQPEKVHAVGSEITGGVVVATTQARCNKKNVQSGMTISSNWEEVTCGSCLKTYVRHDGRKNSPLTLLEYEHEYVTKVGEMEEEERLSICCGADEDENIENMCSACHESTTFTGEEETPSPEPEIDHSIAPSPVKFETVVHSNMNQLISELSGAVAYLEDMNISNNKHPYDIQSQGLYKAIRNAKNIASALRQDAIDRKEINMA